TVKSESELKRIFKNAGVKAIQFDDQIYRKAGLKPLPLNQSPAMVDVMKIGLEKTNGILRNLTNTTALTGQSAFIDAADLAYMQIATGAFDYNSAIRNAVKDIASKGLSVIDFASGRHDQLDVAVRRTVLTGVNQTAGKLTETRADDMDCDLVQTSAHIGARNKGDVPENHEMWQGKVFSRSGKHPKYPNFYEVTGYGTVTGLYGVNCRHSHFPFFEGISEPAYQDLEVYKGEPVTYNGKEMSFYEATQKQREIERGIRRWKREAGALEAAGLDNTAELAKVKEWQAKMRDFVKQTGLQRQRERERIVSINSKITDDPDLNLAKQGKLFSISSPKTDTISNKPIDLSAQYENEQLKANRIVLTPKQKNHIQFNHPEDLDWILSHQELVLEAIKNPLYRDADPRVIRKNIYTISHILPLNQDDYQYLNVVVSFHNGTQNPAQLWTMFRTRNDFLFWKNGELKDRWIKVK
ncbi:MAG: phage minor capsid protein, partial [Bacillota bacterium]